MLIHTRISGHVDVPLEPALAFLGDFQNLPLWHVSVIAVKDVVGTQLEVGSTATLVLKGSGGLVDDHVEVIEAEPLRMSKQVGRGPLNFTSTMRYTPVGRGYDWVWEQENEWPDGLPGVFGDEAFMGRFMEQVLRHSAENARLMLEAMVPVAV